MFPKQSVINPKLSLGCSSVKPRLTPSSAPVIASSAPTSPRPWATAVPVLTRTKSTTKMPANNRTSRETAFDAKTNIRSVTWSADNSIRKCTLKWSQWDDWQHKVLTYVPKENRYGHHPIVQTCIHCRDHRVNGVLLLATVWNRARASVANAKI